MANLYTDRTLTLRGLRFHYLGARCSGATCLLLLLGLNLCLMPARGQAQEESIQEQILAVFHPYRQGPLHPELRLGKNTEWIPQIAAETSIDYQQERASIFQTHKVVHNEPLEEKMFETGALMRQGK